MTAQSLYERLRGVNAIAMVVDHFKVPEREKQELLAVIVSKKTEVVSS